MDSRCSLLLHGMHGETRILSNNAVSGFFDYCLVLPHDCVLLCFAPAGVDGTGDVTKSANIRSFVNLIEKCTAGKGIDLMMAGVLGFSRPVQDSGHLCIPARLAA